MRRANLVLFQLAVNPAKESADARFTGTQIEWMKKPGRGEHGHLRPLPPAIFPRPAAIWRKKRLCLDEDSVKRFPDGRILVIYAKEQIGGFAIHLMQK